MPADGVVGPHTWAALFRTVQLEDRYSPAVSAVQSQLASRGVDIAVDGDFGPQTDAAVRAFQRANGLADNGIVGPRTWAALVAGG
jgi:peptidoglycan hydrolase-like protein with peptidoglycan-binding domain